METRFKREKGYTTGKYTLFIYIQGNKEPGEF